MTHEFNNQASQSDRREVLRNDTLFSRQQNAIDDSGGRFAKLTPATITGVTPAPIYPQLPASTPWSNGFDTNVEPQLGYAVDEMSAPAVSIPEEPTPSVASSGVSVGSDELVALPSVVNLAATEAKSLTSSFTIKRRGFGE